MGNVQNSSPPKTPETLPPSPPLGVNLPPLRPELPKEAQTSNTTIENPGSIEELHKKCKDVFPSPFEGARIVVNKGLSNHFQISHSLQLTSGPSSGYRFGATYVGTHQVSPTEAYPVLLGDIDPNGNLNANVLLQAAENCRFKFQAQSQNGKFQLSQYSLDYKGSDYTATLMCANPNILNGTGVFVAHYLQSVTKNLALGAELIYQRMGAQHGGPTAFTSLAARYNGSDYSCSGTIGLPGIHFCYYQKASEQLQLGVEFETSLRLMEAQASIGYQVDIPKADLVFKGSVDTNWTVSAVLEKRLSPMPFTLALGASLNHRKNDFRLGLGFIIG
ncbi:hypothetical protein V9T40_007780 [Parthenolecanium corni]|uniref:Mitochondrial import receptor subunit TOM40 n=1 Tax=Parthenolecanium corni TaxID=536013 RepID=A0AAN9TKI1_9HEMI